MKVPEGAHRYDWTPSRVDGVTVVIDDNMLSIPHWSRYVIAIDNGVIVINESRDSV